MTTVLRIELLGEFRVHIGDRILTRFATQKAASLLAYLAFYPELHPREVLADILWPDGEQQAGRASLSQALSTLRRQLEPPGVRAGGVILSTKSHVGLNPEAIQTDVADYLSALRTSRPEAGRLQRMQALQHAVDLFHGELLPGIYEEWCRPSSAG